MKTGITLAILGLTAIGLALFATSTQDAVETEFQEFMETYRVSYDTTDEYDFRFKTFQANLKKIEDLRARNPLATFGVNKFSDRTVEETRRMFTRRSNANYPDPCEEATISGTPKNVDWRELMGTIQDQASCGGCWAFATVAVSEGRYALHKGLSTVSQRFSPQQLIDCDGDNYGCGGGFEAYAFHFFEEHDLCDSGDYPYKGRDGTCKGECSTGVRVKTCSKIPEHANDKAVIELQNGPLDVAIDANDVLSYRGGIMTSCSNYGLNHAVTLVGYNSNDNGVETVTIRNSWGESWGESGNFRVQYDGHLCGWDEDAHSITF